MALTLPDYGIAKTIQGGANYASPKPGINSGPGTTNPAPSYNAPNPSSQQPAGYSYLTDLFNQLAPAVKLGIDQSNQQVANLQGQYGQVMANQDYMGGLYNQSLGLQLQGLDLGDQQLQQQRDILARQQGLLPQQNALQQQLYGIQTAGLNANKDQLQQLYGLSLGDLSRQQNQAYFQNDQNQAALRGQLASSGSVVSPGATRQNASLANTFQNQLADLASQGQRAGINYQGSLGDINRGLQQQGINQQQYGLNYQEQLNQLSDQNKALDIVAKQHDLSREDVTNRTNQALAQLGLNTTLTAGQISQAIINAQNGKFDPLTPLLGTIYSAIGLGANGG